MTTYSRETLQSYYNNLDDGSRKYILRLAFGNCIKKWMLNAPYEKIIEAGYGLPLDKAIAKDSEDQTALL